MTDSGSTYLYVARCRPASGSAWPGGCRIVCSICSTSSRLICGLVTASAAALAAGGSASLGVGWHEQRSLGVRVANQGGWRFGSAGSGFDWGFDVGTGERRVGGGRREAGAEPDDLLYQEWRDYWSLGASVHALLLGVEFDFHPVELADFLGGLVGFDLGHDDQVTTRAEPLAGTGIMDLQILRECLIDVRTMEQWALYRERLEAGAETDALNDAAAAATADSGDTG